jgi:formylglycine-generating enzyme required for sulfatase activity
VDLSSCFEPPFTFGASFKDPPTAGWIRARLRWDVVPVAGGQWSKVGAAPEHMQILEASAELAGFGAQMKINPIKTPFFIRYSARDRFVASPVRADGLASPQPDLFVGQSLVPTSAIDTGALAMRGMRLSELAQLPDVSHTLYDFAAGNETCPLLDQMHGKDEPSPFGDAAYDMDACHEFSQVMGAVNSTHFLPGARSVYDHYHGLALARMAVCKAAYATFDTQFYQPFQGQYDNGELARPSAVDSNEPMECEREALAYEMIAQHFLQDAWATGHMWARWGYPTLTAFPTSFPFDPPFPQANAPARRMAFASAVAIVSGTIHGAKSVSGKLLTGYGPLAIPAAYLVGSAAGLNVSVDDPLNAPRFGKLTKLAGAPLAIVGHDVEWRDESDVSQVFPGVGDLFWNGKDMLGSDVPKAKYQTQHDRLVGCGASSLREVYLAGNQAFGPLADTTKLPWSAGDRCWSHWATNDSMLGALGPIYMRTWLPVSPASAQDFAPGAPLGATVLGKVTGLLVDAALDKVGVRFADAADGKEFQAKLGQHVIMDSTHLALDFAANADKDPHGTDSAKLLDIDGAPIKFLGVDPGQALVPDDPGEPPVAYLDRAQPRSPDVHEEDHFVERAFWKSHLKEQACTDFGAVQALAARCKSPVGLAGDTEACTRCVELAEPWVPAYGTKLGPSKCEVLGSAAGGTVPEWYDLDARTSSDDLRMRSHPYYAAVSYCTGTKTDDLGSVLSGGATSVVSSEPAGTYYSGVSGAETRFSQIKIVTRSSVISEVHQQGNGMASANLRSVPGPLVSNVRFTARVGPWDDSCVEYAYTSTREDATRAQLTPLPFEQVGENWTFARRIGGHMNATVVAEDLQPCGLTQEMFFVNRACAALPKAISTSPDAINGYDAASGSWLLQSDVATMDASASRCSALTKRHVASTCVAGVCGASGFCRDGAPPTVSVLDVKLDGAGGAGGSAGAAGGGSGAAGAGAGGVPGAGGGPTAGGSGGADAGGGQACGDGVRNGGEACDGGDVGDATCSSILAKPATGAVVCTSQCMFDFSQCHWCGDGSASGAEQCDGGDLGGSTCASVVGANASGTLACTLGCQFDTSACVVAAQSSCGGLPSTCGAAAKASCCDSGALPAAMFHLGRATGDNDVAPVGMAVDGDEQPATTATVSSVRLDVYEVTVGRLRPFVSAVAGGWLPPAGSGRHAHLAGGLKGEIGWDPTWSTSLATSKLQWGDSGHLSCGANATWTASASGNENKPATCLSWQEAYAFCIWDGGFLPTEAEWELAAAGGSEERIFPWALPGTQAVGPEYAVYAAAAPADVGSRSPLGDGRWGHADLAGNVAEWVLDGYAGYPGGACEDCLSTAGAARVTRGGSLQSPVASLRGAKRAARAVDSRADDVGARCARKP